MARHSFGWGRLPVQAHADALGTWGGGVRGPDGHIARRAWEGDGRIDLRSVTNCLRQVAAATPACPGSSVRIACPGVIEHAACSGSSKDVACPAEERPQ